MGSINLFYNFVSSAVLLFSLVVWYIFTRYNYKYSTTGKIISVLLFFLFLRSFSIHLFISKDILYLPHFLLINHLISRLALPLMFLMVFYEVNKRSFRWYDLLHFLPALLFVINFFPVYFTSAAVKLKIIDLMLKEGYDSVWDFGILFSSPFVFWIRVAPLLFYMVLILILVSYKRNYTKISKITFMFFIGLLIYLSVNIIPLFFTNLSIIGDRAVYLTYLLFFISTLCVLIYFFVSPHFLYKGYFMSLGQYPMILSPEIKKNNKEEKLMIEIEKYLLRTKAFLNPDFSLAKIETAMSISGSMISQTIKSEKEVNFSRYIKNLRIEYFINNINQNHFDQPICHTAFEMGFNSANIFFTLFKSKMGCTPKQYLINLKNLSSG